MSLRDLTWRERGEHDCAHGTAKDDPPITDGIEYDHWLEGWEVENQNRTEELDEETVLITKPNYLKLLLTEDGNVYLTDPDGKVLGLQSGIILNKTETEEVWTATVTFTDLKMVTDETN